MADSRGERDWLRPVKRLAPRHGVLALEVRDPREQALPDVGEVVLRDPESGRQLRVDTHDRVLRERYAAAAARERDELRRAVRSTGADHVVLSTAGDWLRLLASFLANRRARR